METQVKSDTRVERNETSNQRITPFLWFNNQAEEAANFYISVFKNSRIKNAVGYGEAGAEASGMEKGTVMTVSFQLEGQDFTAINGGSVFQITPAISFFVNCDTIQEIDKLWEKLSNGGETLMELGKYPFSERYGWLKDKYGVTWQLILGTNSQKICTSLLFVKEQNGKAEEAMNYYASLFPDSKILRVERYNPGEGGQTGTVKYGKFVLGGQEFIAMDSNGPHQFTFTPALSLVVNCDTQDEIDHYWDRLCEGGEESAQQCGWLQDKFGVSWQIVPTDLEEMLSNPDSKKAGRVMQAILKMKKLDLATIHNAYNLR